ncbi:hypothetical protein [Desulfitobacterium metallireducens]|nr:hypothetical protein [Desulfitobacterium metallireducens]
MNYGAVFYIGNYHHILGSKLFSGHVPLAGVPFSQEEEVDPYKLFKGGTYEKFTSNDFH